LTRIEEILILAVLVFSQKLWKLRTVIQIWLSFLILKRFELNLIIFVLDWSILM